MRPAILTKMCGEGRGFQASDATEMIIIPPQLIRWKELEH